MGRGMGVDINQVVADVVTIDMIIADAVRTRPRRAVADVINWSANDLVAGKVGVVVRTEVRDRVNVEVTNAIADVIRRLT